MTSPLHGEGRRFESGQAHRFWRIADRVPENGLHPRPYPHRRAHLSGDGSSGIEAYIQLKDEALSVNTVKLSARNQFPGTVKHIETGMVIAEVIIALDGGGEITSVITKKAAENLGLTVGKKVYAVVKSTEVMVATD
jgi:molybdopterin-binding protein